MPIFTPTQKLQRFPANTVGKDYIVGDLHGVYDDFIKALHMLGFDGQVDRCFSVGDLVDRGPKNKECAELIYEDWFYAVKGNHELMMCDAIVRNNQNQLDTWMYNGGQWILEYGYNSAEIKDLAEALDCLPLVIVVGEGENRFNIVHGEFVKRDDDWKVVPVTDEIVDNWEFDSMDEDRMVWGRSIIQDQPDPAHPRQDPDKMSITYCGHTPLQEPVRAAQQVFIDTGAVFGHKLRTSYERAITIVCHTTGMVHCYRMMDSTIDTRPLSDLLVQAT